jgi:hypothetical protein
MNVWNYFLWFFLTDTILKNIPRNTPTMPKLCSKRVVNILLAVALCAAVSAATAANASETRGCNQHSSCSSCTNAASGRCGWCASTQSCEDGTGQGPNQGTCSTWSWYSSQCDSRPQPPAPTAAPGQCGSDCERGCGGGCECRAGGQCWSQAPTVSPNMCGSDCERGCGGCHCRSDGQCYVTEE